MKSKLPLYITGGIALVMIITNPSVKDLKDYLGEPSYDGIKRTSNFFVFSTYKYHSRHFLGVIGNVWQTNRETYSEPVKEPVIDSAVMDSSVHDSTVYVKHTDKADRLYQTLINEGYTKSNLGSESEFKSAISNPAKASKIYYNLVSEGYTKKNLGSLSEFKQTFCSR